MFEEMMPVGLKKFVGGVEDVINTVGHAIERVQHAYKNGADEITVDLDGTVVSRYGDEFIFDMPPQKIVLPMNERKGLTKWFLSLDVWTNVWKALSGGADQVTIDDDGTVIALFSEEAVMFYGMPELNLVGGRFEKQTDKHSKNLLRGALSVRAVAN